MNVRTKMLGAALAATVAVGVITAASASASKPAHHFRAGHGKGSITGFPTEIKTVDLSGYTIVTSYTLGNNTGSTFQQDYCVDGASTRSRSAARSSAVRTSPATTPRCPSATRC